MGKFGVTSKLFTAKKNERKPGRVRWVTIFFQNHTQGFKQECDFSKIGPYTGDFQELIFLQNRPIYIEGGWTRYPADAAFSETAALQSTNFPHRNNNLLRREKTAPKYAVF